MTLMDKYRHKDLLEELLKGQKAIRCGYLTREGTDLVRWLCLASYEEIKRLKERAGHA